MRSDGIGRLKGHLWGCLNLDFIDVISKVIVKGGLIVNGVIVIVKELSWFDNL